MAKSNFKPLSDALAKLNANRKATTKAPKAKQPSPQMSLELWPDSVRGVPNAVLRGSLFTVSQRRSTFNKRELLAAVEGIEVRFKGQRFNQTDLDVWEMLLHLARLQPLDNRVEFTAHAFLKEMGRGIGKFQHEQLKEEIMRLVTGGVEITWTKENKTFGGTLVSEFYRDEETQRYVVVFSKKMLELYEGGYSHIDWTQRKALGNNNLAKWLHGFYATHAVPFPYKVETIMTLCGSTTKELYKFRQTLKAALIGLVEVGALMSWEIDKNDLITISKTPSLAQQRHIKRTGK
jgi:hypothetical protein